MWSDILLLKYFKTRSSHSIKWSGNLRVGKNMHIVWFSWILQWILYTLKTFTVMEVSKSVTSASRSGVWWMKGYFLLYPEGRNTEEPANRHSAIYIFTPQYPYSFHNRNNTGRPYSQMSPSSSLEDPNGPKVCQKVRTDYPCNVGSLLATGPPA
jgi:hypothetical protein